MLELTWCHQVLDVNSSDVSKCESLHDVDLQLSAGVNRMSWSAGIVKHDVTKSWSWCYVHKCWLWRLSINIWVDMVSEGAVVNMLLTRVGPCDQCPQVQGIGQHADTVIGQSTDGQCSCCTSNQKMCAGQSQSTELQNKPCDTLSVKVV